MKNPNEDFKRITVDQNLFDTIRRKNAFICDMDGVLYHGNRLIPGAKDFIEWLKREKKKFLFLTNSSERSPQELADKLQRLGIDVDKEHFYTSALATAEFLASQKPGGSAYIIGEAGLINALYNVGYTINDVNPDYVVVGEARTYNLEVLTHSVNLVRRGARLVGTNPDITGPVEKGIMPATGALVKPIELATGKKCESVDDAHRFEKTRLRPRRNRHHRRPHGYRYPRRRRNRNGYRSRLIRCHITRRNRHVCLQTENCYQ